MSMYSTWVRRPLVNRIGPLIDKKEYRRGLTFETEYTRLLKMAYPKKDFRLVNEWINALKKNPKDWKKISKDHNIRVSVGDSTEKVHFLKSAWYTNGQFGIDVAKNWLSVFDHEIYAAGFAASVRAMYAHETSHSHQDEEARKNRVPAFEGYISPLDGSGKTVLEGFKQNVEVDAYAAEIGQYCKELGMLPKIALNSLCHVGRREMLSAQLKERFNCNILDIYFGVIRDAVTQKRFLWEVYDYMEKNP